MLREIRRAPPGPDAMVRPEARTGPRDACNRAVATVFPPVSVPTLGDQLPEIIEGKIKDGYGSACQLAQTAGVDRSVLSRFVAGKRTMTLEAADRPAELLKRRIVGRGR